MSQLIAIKDPATGLPVGTVAVFLTLGSALVALFPVSERTAHGKPGFRWLCLGCGTVAAHRTERGPARDAANAHAADCRSIPWPQLDDQS